MAPTYDSQRLRQLRQMDQRLTAEHRALARNVAALVQLAAVNRAGQEATVPNTQSARADLKAAIWQRAVKPYYIGGGDDAFRDNQPASPYARLLYDGVSGAVRIQVERQAKMLSRQVKDRAVLAWLTGQRPRIVTEQRGMYEPFHRWVDPNGYRLSDRVWTTAIDVRTRIDRLLDYEIAQGTSATRIAALLEDFLTPGAALIKTNTPYGSEGSYAARRLARTEITAAAGRATVNAAHANPFVQGIRWALSATHRPEKADQCDYNARGGTLGEGVYTPDSVPRYPNHPHCMCSLVPVPAGSTSDLVESLRTEIYTQSPFAKQLQGLLNPEFLHQAIMDGSIGDVVRRMIATRTLPAARAVAVAQTVSPAYDLSEGKRVRQQIGGRLDELERARITIEKQQDELTERINHIVREFNAQDLEGLPKAERERRWEDYYKTKDPLQAERTALWNRLDQIQKDRANVTREALRLPQGQRSTVSLRESSAFRGKAGVVEMRKKQTEALDFVNDITTGVDTSIFVDMNTTGRAYALRGEISVDLKTPTSTVIHELGHNIEYARGADYRAKRIAFFEDRTRGDALEQLSTLNPGYDAKEVYKRDKWLDEYMGKVYAHDSDQRAASELVSMGIEYLYTAPSVLIAKDPEYFDFIVSYLRGTL